jgi:NAD(P)-dependent dehydrogenase (short-subunit alcohol dehydrogenase family)
MSASAQDTRARVGVVTGASSGIGAAIARAFGRLGWTVALGARRTDRLEDVARQIRQDGGRPFSHALDVTSAASVDAFFDAAEAAVGMPDVVVNNAGIGIPGMLHELRVEDLQREILTNLLGPMLVVRRVLPSMIERRRGDLVFITSLNTVMPRPFQVGYSASKAGLEAMARTLQMELEGTGIRSTIVRPGPTLTEFGAGWDPRVLARVLDSWKEWGVMRHRQILPPESVAAAVVSAVTAPPGTHLDVIQINPEGPPRA